MLTMRQVTKATELKRFKELEGEYHYMGETHSGGDTMRLVFEEDGKWVALMVWGSACYHLKPRDAHVGWANSIRAERLKLVVNNRQDCDFYVPNGSPKAVWAKPLCKDALVDLPNLKPRDSDCRVQRCGRLVGKDKGWRFVV